MGAKAIIVAVIVALIGGTYEVLADVGPLKGMNFGLGLTSSGALSKTIGVPGGYNVADIVMVVIFLVVIAIAYFVLSNMRKKNKAENKTDK
jgi:heme/copper-type cytochrome/quinol oxidase subunit 2